jgi:hypothetical protein
MYDGPNLRLDGRALDFMLDNPRGPVGQHLSRIGTVILTGARAMVGVDTGRLRRSLYKRQSRDTRGQYVQVGSNVGYAYDHHEGVAPHVIEASTGRMLRFRQGGQIVYARRVMNPGYRGRKYLTVPLRRAVR